MAQPPWPVGLCTVIGGWRGTQKPTQHVESTWALLPASLPRSEEKRVSKHMPRGAGAIKQRESLASHKAALVLRPLAPHLVPTPC